MDSIAIFKQTRPLLQGAVAGLKDEALFLIPAGFDNNIAWNLGHIIVTQQALHYRLSSLPTVTTRADRAMFKTGTSPADWIESPDAGRLLDLLAETTESLPRDYEAGVFSGFRPYTTSTGVALNSIGEALVFNDYHEGLHLGTILALRNFVVAY